MSEPNPKAYVVGDTFNVQYVWQLPESGDYLRMVYEAEVLERDDRMERYHVRLLRWVVGRQEAPDGSIRPKTELTVPMWQRALTFPGAEVSIAYEVADGRSIRLRTATLTGEHTHFTRKRSD